MKTLEYILLNIKRIGYSRVLTQLDLVYTHTQSKTRQPCIKELEEECRYLEELIYTMSFSGTLSFKTSRFLNYRNNIKPNNVMGSNENT